MINVVSVSTMRLSDSQEIINRTAGVVLMKRASFGLYKYMDTKQKTAIVCGTGNNGGDGLCLMEILLDENIDCADIYILGDIKTDNAKYYYDRLVAKNCEIKYINANTDLKDYTQIIDCLLGTGLTKSVEGLYLDIINNINNSSARIISADIPSGLNGDNGLAMGIAVNASLTVSFGAYKVGHWLNSGRDYCGELYNVDIGIAMLEPIYHINESINIKPYFDTPHKNVHKGSFGKCAIIGGSSNYIGAIVLADMGATSLQVGAGLNVIGVPKFLYSALYNRIIESTLYELEDLDGYIVADDKLNKLIDSCDGVALGMGMGISKYGEEVVRLVISQAKKMVLDADALNNLAKDMTMLDDVQGDIIITPHPKELSSLIGVKTSEILSNPIAYATATALKYGVTVLLKGVTTIITDGVNVSLNITGTSNMAKGGSGDILAGIIGGLLARGLSSYEAGIVGSYIAGKSNEYAVADTNIYTNLPHNNTMYLSKVISDIICSEQ